MVMMKKLGQFIGVLGVVATITPGLAQAYSIADAVQAAKVNNLSIKLSQDNLDNTKTQKMKAVSGFLPTVVFGNSNNNTQLKVPIAKEAYGNPYTRTTTFQLTQPIFSGGSSVFNLKAADASIEGASYSLIATEEQIILNAISAYEKLLTARELYQINVTNEEVLKEQLAETRAKLALGEATVTDEAQIVANLYQATAQKIQAQGNITNAEAQFTTITGQMPPEKMTHIKYDTISLPSTLEEFMSVVAEKNATIIAAKNSVTAAKNNTRVAYAALSPVVSATAQSTRSNDLPGVSNRDGESYTLNLQVPIFQGGAEYAGISSARAQERSAEHTYEQSVTQVTQQVVQAWSDYYTTKAVLEFATKSASAAEEALQGVKAGAQVGTKTTLDVLIAEQKLFEAKVSSKEAKSQNVVAVFTIQSLLNKLNQMNFEAL